MKTGGVEEAAGVSRDVVRFAERLLAVLVSKIEGTYPGTGVRPGGRLEHTELVKDCRDYGMRFERLLLKADLYVSSTEFSYYRVELDKSGGSFSYNRSVPDTAFIEIYGTAVLDENGKVMNRGVLMSTLQHEVHHAHEKFSMLASGSTGVFGGFNHDEMERSSDLYYAWLYMFYISMPTEVRAYANSLDARLSHDTVEVAVDALRSSKYWKFVTDLRGFSASRQKIMFGLHSGIIGEDDVRWGGGSLVVKDPALEERLNHALEDYFLGTYNRLARSMGLKPARDADDMLRKMEEHFSRAADAYARRLGAVAARHANRSAGSMEKYFRSESERSASLAASLSAEKQATKPLPPQEMGLVKRWLRSIGARLGLVEGYIPEKMGKVTLSFEEFLAESRSVGPAGAVRMFGNDGYVCYRVDDLKSYRELVTDARSVLNFESGEDTFREWTSDCDLYVLMSRVPNTDPKSLVHLLVGPAGELHAEDADGRETDAYGIFKLAGLGLDFAVFQHMRQ